MFPRVLHSSVCASCRLRSSIVAKQIARSRIHSALPNRSVSRVVLVRNYASTTNSLRQEDDGSTERQRTKHDGEREEVFLDRGDGEPKSPEEAAVRAREVYGDAIPNGLLGEEGMRIYERLYGKPVEVEDVREDEDGGVLLLDDDGTGVLKEGEGGVLEEVEFEEEEMDDTAEETGDGEEYTQSEHDAMLAADVDAAVRSDGAEGVGEYAPDYPGEEGDEPYIRAHPLTIANRFGTTPSSLPMPQGSMVDTIAQQLAGKPNVHLAEAAHRVFGGMGLPYSTSTPRLGGNLQQKPIGLDAAESHMSDIEADAFMATLVPGMYATVMSTLVETRKRLGTAWAEQLVARAAKGELRILDAGGAGAGVLAVREIVRAEWERMHEGKSGPESGTALAEADGKLGGASISAPLGLATVLTGSDTLRKRASEMLENTTFVPRLPDYLHAEDAKKKGKFDIIVAPYTLWQLKEDYIRKSHMQNLWSMLSQDGGIMLIIEKGIPRGFELVAGARNMLLETRISNTGFDAAEEGNESPRPALEKDKGMIVAPCTNHERCPMYEPQGMVKGRKDICHFEQRYVRPPFLQRILGAKSKNWEDVKFSYVSIMRGRDLREEADQGIIAGEEGTARAFEGYGDLPADTIRQMDASTAITPPHSLSLPRAVLPPLKRQGHIILDLCTPSGTLERWTVPRSFGKQAFRDARKSAWGDLWALGAKTSVPRNPKIKKRKTNADLDVSAKVKATRGGLTVDEYGRIVSGSQVEEERSKGGLMRGRRVKGVRDKRDKRGDGNGRRKRQHES